MDNQHFVAAAYTGLLSNSYIMSHIENGVVPNMTNEEKQATRRKSAKDVADYAVLLGEVLAARYHEVSDGPQ